MMRFRFDLGASNEDVGSITSSPKNIDEWIIEEKGA
jgi:hypothetical protein